MSIDETVSVRYMVDDVEKSVAFYTDLLKKVAGTEEFKAYQQRGAQIPRLLTGDEFKAFIETHEQSYREIYKQAGWLRE